MRWTRNGISTVAANVAEKAADLLTPSSSLSSTPLPPGTRDPEFGTSTTVKTYYQGKNSSHNQIDWVETPPKQLSPKAARENTKVAIKIFKLKDTEQPTISGKTPLKTSFVEIQSPLLVSALKPILKDADMHIEASEPVKFTEPFKPLFFSYEKIGKLIKEAKKGELLKEHLDLLGGVLGELFGGFLDHLKNLNASGLISYELAWTYFPKGEKVFCASKDCERVYRILSTEYLTKPVIKMGLVCEEIAFDGERFSFKEVIMYIPMFVGNKLINELTIYPLKFHQDPKMVTERLTERAMRAIEYQELTYCEYTGVAMHIPQYTPPERHNVDCRVLIDHLGYKKHHEGLERKGNVTVTPPPVPQPRFPNDFMDFDISHKVLENEIVNGRPPRPGQPYRGSKPEKTVDQVTYVEILSMEKQERNKKEIMSRKEDMVFVSPLLEGFALKNKLWLQFYIDDLKPVIWNDDAYSHLVYPEEQKDLVLTFVDNHQRLKERVDDVIMGKGQGLILLLSGPPGTGKTLTAEAVADKTRRPLYYLQAEDLGTNPAELGPKIKKVFEMATEWDAVILLDEADVFMAERHPQDIARNELVSIFLRELEYFKGIIFLTTNLYSTIDTAFRSRVNIHLLYRALSAEARLELWQKFLLRVSTEGKGDESIVKDVNEEDFVELSKWELNGREIKNAIKTVRTWCVCKGYDLNLLRLESGIRVTAPQATKIEKYDSTLYES